ncbi:MAG: M20 family metallopeptidase [Actinobacteria bacterium]|nr:M20 family metallopeptidase [Actinomycetota bacterium]
MEPPHPRDLAASIERRHGEFVEALEAMVNVDCGSFTPDGVNAIADACEERFREGGWEVRRIPHEPSGGGPRLGDLVVGTLPGGDPHGSALLLVGHMDTVFPEGTVAERPFRIEGTRARGPGVSDMKAGLLAGFFAAGALRDAGFDGFRSLIFVCNPDEEIGSPFSGAHITELAAGADAALVLEGARENGDVVSARKGVSDVRIEVAGRAAHAGIEPERGRSAIVEAAHKVRALHELNGRWPGVTVNVGVIEGGTRPNVVPDRCSIEADVRAFDRAAFAEALAEVRRVAGSPTVPGTTASVVELAGHPPMERTPAVAALVELARAIAGELGFELRDAATGGASDANKTAAAGVPTLDGLGPVGGDDHGPAEWLDLKSVTPRVALLAALISRLGRGVPRPGG